jgi:hypothetical protein
MMAFWGVVVTGLRGGVVLVQRGDNVVKMGHEGGAEMVQGFDQRGIEPPRVMEAGLGLRFGGGDVFAALIDGSRGLRSWRRHYSSQKCPAVNSDTRKRRACLR